MVAVKTKSVLNELMRACKEAQTCFLAWSGKSSNESLRRLLVYRARACARNESEIAALMEQNADSICVGPDLNGVTRRRSWSALRRAIRRVGARNLLSACEAEDSRTLVRYRDALEFELPDAVRRVVARQFAELIDQHARIVRLRQSAPPVHEAAADQPDLARA